MNSLRHSFSILLLLMFIIAVNCLEGLYYFYQQPEYPRDCTEVYAHCSSSNSSGVYTIKPDGYAKPFEVYCNNELSPGGWTIISRQFDGSLTFTRTWEDYKEGFGFLSSEFYIGNEKLSYLTNQADYELRIDMMLSNGSYFYIRYKKFRISDDFSQYGVVSAGGFSGNSSCVATSCPIEMVHESCNCETSCSDPTGKTGCREICVETCVPKGCFVNETSSFIMEGDLYVDIGCTKRCLCTNGQLTCDNLQCNVNAVCERRSEYHQCYCNPGFSGDGVTCRAICSTNKIYGTCSCQKSCANPTSCIACSGQKCYCPNGFYLQGGDCVRQEQCGCYIDGNILQEGATFVISDCTRRCTCNNNHLNCDSNYQCDSNAACRVENNVRQCYCNPGFSGDGVTCPPICSTNEVYGTCSCQRSCANPTHCASCSGQKCYCPNGFYLQGGDCVRQEQCGCYIDGNILQNGCTFINTDCTLKCVCRNDQINCNTNFQCSPYAECREDDGIRGCYCNKGFEGDGETCTPLYRDCYDVYQADETTDGVYSILPDGWPGEPFSVLCNMTSDGGGWTVFQRRIDGVTDFYRDWASYKNGFGSLENDFWLGNEQLHYLTKQRVYQLRIDMVTSQDSPVVQTYPEFAVGHESVNYEMTLDRGNARTGLFYNTGHSFSTYDHDNDGCSVYNCAVQHQGGWWYGSISYWCNSCYSSQCSNFNVGGCSTACTDSNLNGDYTGGNGQNIIWYRDASGRYCNMKYADMKIRPVT